MDWTRGQTIGRGSTATVSIGMSNRSGDVFAVKSAELSNSEFLQREQRILSALACPQIVAYKGCDISAENGKILYNLFLEYAPGGTLTDAIRSGTCLEEGRIRSHTRAVLLGLQYLHSNGIVHCDIKGQNILVSKDNEQGAKIADFGCARRARVNEDEVKPICGTPICMAPEVARGEEQGFPADVWALGCTVLEMATGRPPWPDVADPISALHRIGFSSDTPEIPGYMSKQAQDFLSKCLIRNPGERWSASELLEHGFVKEQNFKLSTLTEHETYNSESPTSVLNQQLWDSTLTGCSSASAKERIRQLIGEGSSEMINWAWDETWVTVRSKEPGGIGSQLDCNLSSAAANVVPIGGGASRISAAEECDMDIHIIIPDPDDQFFSTSEANTCNTSSISNISRRDKSLLMACKCTNHILCYFRISLSLCSLALLWKILSEPKSDSQNICHVKAEFLHHVGVNYLYAPWIPLLLLLQSAPLTVLNKVVYPVLCWVFSVPVVLLDVKIYGQWFTTEKRFLSVFANPTSQISVIANFTVVQAAAQIGWQENAVCMFSLAWCTVWYSL
ncbi:mitogen-activated protein kinase kinase kinase 18 [Citrus clementina]|uniref:mitogen-activated protein kinase kinase kinase 18 n=1 Tax=Citrus clementina TaxID=85681 RepID=UPI000CECE84F|nr:mitogen-activated protein kinase kinase kinase 18 [Citrus x clementina]